MLLLLSTFVLLAIVGVVANPDTGEHIPAVAAAFSMEANVLEARVFRFRYTQSTFGGRNFPTLHYSIIHNDFVV